ncbi:lytic transglycosylase [Marinobacterium rhizophilum]|uniref:LysM peptidoglycan-binding domain-containing protein n=1 Tax=Marinobacterium rhizophilum TaxID=420402 RepID=A0ABY5HP70_9GAMM|nr:LysM peptidoglycan-binding domain-containing protein [Marinobacterium rhizophilum]UTW13676.1 LysM peptidoglycan-binding domain-containing protein [Marinobacterium rhizophilum]
MTLTRNWISITAAGLLLSGCSSALTQNPDSSADALRLPGNQAGTHASPWETRATGSRDSIGRKARANTTAPPEDLWQLSRNHFELNLESDNPRVASQIRYYSKHQDYLDRVTDRAERYYHYILQQIIERGLPAELALLPVVESAYDPFAYSPSRAAGPWQFIPGTAKHFGLRKTWWYDGRRDIVASTDAALTYLEQLNKRFDGDWLLALAAYNAGGGTVSKAIRKNTKKGLATDFWSLDLPSETEAYVPKLLAIASLVKAPADYGVSLRALAVEPYFAIIETQGQIDLAQAAKMADTSSEEMALLNPGFSRWATDPEGPHRLLVPIDSAMQFENKLASLPAEQRVRWNRYRIQRGDSLSAIAARFNISTAAIRSANKLKSNRITAGKTLLIPGPANTSLAATVAQDGAAGTREKLSYKVRAGDSFWKIARSHKVSVSDLASWNKMTPRSTLKAGQQLTLWRDSSLASSAQRETLRKVGYSVRSGDSLSLIASRFSVSVADLKRWNGLNKGRYLQPGQKLTLFVNATDS